MQLSGYFVTHKKPRRMGELERGRDGDRERLPSTCCAQCAETLRICLLSAPVGMRQAVSGVRIGLRRGQGVQERKERKESALEN